MDTQRKQRVVKEIESLKRQLKGQSDPLTKKDIQDKLKIFKDILEIIEEQEQEAQNENY